MCVNRYSTMSCPTDGITLLLAHANGTYKEHWEPVLEHIFHSQAQSSHLGIIREAYSFDWHTHGDSAVLNERALSRLHNTISIAEWAEAIATFATKHVAGHRLVAIGHSAGSSTMMYSTRCYSTPVAPYEAIILVEPGMIDRQVFNANIKDREQQIAMVTKVVSVQRTRWESRNSAYEWFSSRRPWKSWDPRIRVIKVNHGLRSVHPDIATGPVIAKCDRCFEAANYSDFEGSFQATEQIEKICSRVPVNFIFGEQNDLIPRYAQESLLDGRKGRKAAFITYIPGAGHMVVQQKPELLAEATFVILGGRLPVQSRL
ncbi:alpha/beta-hydrolase [Neolentinus lepideus HHB14362 ss-1]|uniref:Alpha/beta-hydrolase n=1 Tax=Neolentinus lepideus HHB14362 ss-1 TaxID=1314782 RepID=A0A165PPD9_9AGAM|nr:alpha/beta-hydrolase [Neolentinus lepideus HHB14362 ss-1]